MSKLDENYDYFTGDGEPYTGEEEYFICGKWEIPTAFPIGGNLNQTTIYRRPKKFKAGDRVRVLYCTTWVEKKFLFECDGLFWVSNGIDSADGYAQCKPIGPKLTAEQKLNKIKELVEQGEDVTNKIKDIL